MKLKNLIGSVSPEYGDIHISDICHDADKVSSGSLFVCLSGSRHDGHDFAVIAAQKGAAAIVGEKELDVSCPYIKTDNARKTFALACAAFYGNPAKSLKMYGITGTNGKTTTAYVLAEILKKAGEEVGLIGTNCIEYCGHSEPAVLTTPDPMELNDSLCKMKNCGVTAVVMEVSAHALALYKTAGIVYDAVGFTNLSQDHLDYFSDMETYGNAKKRLFTPENAKCAAINADDKFGRLLISEANIPVLSYGKENPADVFGINVNMSAEGLSYVINIADDIGEVKFALPGRFNMYNTLCAAAMAHLSRIKLKDILAGIRSLKRVDGRFNVINTSTFSIIIDFAHTDDGLGNIITSVREFAPERIITVFGCGGNRDKSKRAVMGRAASTLSDITVITSDNPRDEDPEAIIKDVLGGVPSDRLGSVYTNADRREAIKLAFKLATGGDIVIVAGKGAEKYQEIKGIKYPYNDEEYIMRLLQNRSVND